VAVSSGSLLRRLSAPNNLLQQTAAASLVLESSPSLGAAAAAERIVRRLRSWRDLMSRMHWRLRSMRSLSSAFGGGPDEEMAPVAFLRWSSFARRHPKAMSDTAGRHHVRIIFRNRAAGVAAAVEDASACRNGCRRDARRISRSDSSRSAGIRCAGRAAEVAAIVVVKGVVVEVPTAVPFGGHIQPGPPSSMHSGPREGASSLKK
jgi:hypothetical protein